MKKSKRHIANLELIDKNKVYTIEEAVALVRHKFSYNYSSMRFKKSER